MDLRELKKEVHKLPNVEKALQEFKDSWIKPLRSNSNSHLPFVKQLSPEARKELNKKLRNLNTHDVKEGDIINQKLQHLSRYLIDMKLLTLRGYHTQSATVTSRILNDDFLNLRDTISHVQTFETSVQNLSTTYHEVNELLQKHLSLEEAIFFLDLPHKKYLQNLMKISQKQKTLVRKLGHHFVSLAKKP